MSKPSARRPQNNVGEMLVKQIQNAAEKRKAEMAESNELEEQSEDLNILPMPDSQEIYNNGTSAYMEWRWRVDKTCVVIGILYTQDSSWPEVDSQPDRPKGTYDVQLSFDEQPHSVFTFTPEFSKALGQRMISASNWINIWKIHAGAYLEKDLMGE